MNCFHLGELPVKSALKDEIGVALVARRAQSDRRGELHCALLRRGHEGDGQRHLRMRTRRTTSSNASFEERTYGMFITRALHWKGAVTPLMRTILNCP